MADVSDDADDFALRIILAHDFSDGIFAGPQSAREGFVDDDNFGGIGGIALGEIAAGAQRNSHGVEISGADDADESIGIIIARVGLSLGGDAPAAIAAKGKRVGQAGSFDSGDFKDAAKGFVVVDVFLGLRGIRGIWINAKGGGALGAEAEVHIENAKEAANEQAGADEKYASESDFRNNQAAANPGVTAALARAAIGIFEDIVKSESGNLEGGEKSEDDARKDGDEQGKGEGGGVHVDAGEERNADGVEVGEQARASEGEKQAERGAEKREHEAFGKHLANEAGFAGAKSGADGDFFLARCGTREKEIRKVGTNDKHDNAYSAGEDEESGAKASTDMSRDEREAGFEIVAFRMLARDLFTKDGGFGLRGLDGDAGIQPADDGKSVAPAVGFFAKRKGRVQVDTAAGSEDRAEVEGGGENAGDGDGLVIESE